MRKTGDAAFVPQDVAAVGIGLSLVALQMPLALPLTTAALGVAALALYRARWAGRRT